MKRSLLAAALALAAPYSYAAPGVVTCHVEQVAGLTQKLVVYRSGGKTYAINGQARQRASKRGWIDGKEAFTPEQMRQLLDEGLKKC